MSKKNFPPHIVDGGASYQQKVEEAPYHPGYEDAVITPHRSDPVYKGMDPAKMLWKPKPLSDEEIESIYYKGFNFEGADMVKFARAIEERHGIK